MTGRVVDATYRWVDGSPQAAENPPHDARWRQMVAAEVTLVPGAVELGFDFELEPRRVRIDLDNMVRLAIDGLRDSGVVQPGGRGIERIVATKRAGGKPGLGVAVVWTANVDPGDPFAGGADLDVATNRVPTEDDTASKLAWRDVVAATWAGEPVTDPVGIDIETTSPRSLAGLLKPIIDGLEPYLGREPSGRGTLRPRDHTVTWLRIARLPAGPTVRVRAGPAPHARVGRTIPPVPHLPPSDPDFSMDLDVVEALERWMAWRKVFDLR